MRFRAPSEAVAVVCTAIVAACLFTYPYVLHFSDSGRVDTNDGRWSIWVVAWVAHALTTDPLNVFNANIYYPHDNALAFSEGNLVGGAMAIPAWLLTKNAFAAHNFFFIFAFVLSSVATYYLVRYLTGDRMAAAVAAILFAYCPFAFARQAHSQLLLIGFLPWCMLAFHRLVDRNTLPRAIELGVVMWLTGLACAYYGVFAGLIVATATIVFAITRGLWKEPRYWVAFGVAAAVCLGLTIPLFMPYLEMQESTGFARSLKDSHTYSANAGAWLASSAWAHAWWYPYLQPPYFIDDPSEVLFPGILATVLGAWGATHVVRRWFTGRHGNVPNTSTDAGTIARAIPNDVGWFYVGTAIIAFWTTFGPKAGLYTLFFHTIPVFSFLRAPARTGIVVTLGLVVLAAIAMTRMIRGRRVVFAVLMVLAVGDLFRAPLRMRQARQPAEAHRMLARLPKGPVIELPYWYERLAYPRHAEYMLLSTYHWQPMINGYSDHIPQDFRDTAVALSSFPTRESFAILEKLGARYAMFHLNLMDERTREKTIQRIQEDYEMFLRPLSTSDDVWLFEIIAWPH
jgi:hypothetical protein